jgi:hypothetical protein
MPSVRTGLVRGLVVAVLAILPGSATQAQPASSQTVQWRDLKFQITADWHQTKPDPQKEFEGRRVIYGRVEALHSLSLDVFPREAPAALAQSEVADRYLETSSKLTSENGTYGDWKKGSRAIAGTDYVVVSGRFTPTSKTPINDFVDVLVFPEDYNQRQRWYSFSWNDSHSATTGPNSLDELDSIIASLSLRPVGTVLIGDDFMNPDAGLFRATTVGDHYTLDYLDGEFQIQKTDPNWSNVGVAYAPGVFQDTSLAVDVYVANDDALPGVYLYCRRNASIGSYRAVVDLRGSARLGRVKPDGTTDELTPWTRSEAIQTGTATNHFEMICRGTAIELDANGTYVVGVRNADMFEGQVGIGGASFTASLLPDLRFANLLVVQR